MRAENDGVIRRDFLRGKMLAAGGVEVRDHSPRRQDALREPRIAPMSRPHLRIRRRNAGEAERFDLIIVGAGLSGLATAFFALNERPDLSILLLESSPLPGGNAARDERLFPPAQSSGAYIIYPYSEFLWSFYKGIDLRPDEHVVASPFFSYFFDSRFGPTATRQAMTPGTKRWTFDVLSRQGIDDLPFPEPLRGQFHLARAALADWLKRDGAPTDPPEESDTAFDALAFRSFRDYLTLDLGLDGAVAEFFDLYTSDCLGAATADVNAHTCISHLSAELEPRCAFPGGNSFLVRHALSALIPGSVRPGPGGGRSVIDPSALDRPASRVRCRTGARAMRLHDRRSEVVVSYAVGPRSYSARGRAVVLAAGIPAARRLAEDLMSEEQRTAAASFRPISTVVATLAVRHSRFLVRAGCGYDHYWYGGKHWQDFIVADWPSVGNDPARSHDGARPNVLVVYATALAADGTTDWQAQREARALTTTFGQYEDSLRSDLHRLFDTDDFDFDRDVSAIHLHRSDDAIVVPVTDWLFGQPLGKDGHISRTDGPRSIARRRLGRISFAGADSEGAPSVECAIASGHRAFEEALSCL